MAPRNFPMLRQQQSADWEESDGAFSLLDGPSIAFVVLLTVMLTGMLMMVLLVLHFLYKTHCQPSQYGASPLEHRRVAVSLDDRAALETMVQQLTDATREAFCRVRVAMGDLESVEVLSGPARRFVVAATSEAEEPPKCPICLDPLRPGESVRCLARCQHQFHCACLDEWLLHFSAHCPICKQIAIYPPPTSDAHPTPRTVVFEQRLRRHTQQLFVVVSVVPGMRESSSVWWKSWWYRKWWRKRTPTPRTEVQVGETADSPTNSEGPPPAYELAAGGLEEPATWIPMQALYSLEDELDEDVDEEEEPRNALRGSSGTGVMVDVPAVRLATTQEDSTQDGNSFVDVPLHHSGDCED